MQGVRRARQSRKRERLACLHRPAAISPCSATVSLFLYHTHRTSQSNMGLASRLSAAQATQGGAPPAQQQSYAPPPAAPSQYGQPQQQQYAPPGNAPPPYSSGGAFDRFCPLQEAANRRDGEQQQVGRRGSGCCTGPMRAAGEGERSSPVATETLKGPASAINDLRASPRSNPTLSFSNTWLTRSPPSIPLSSVALARYDCDTTAYPQPQGGKAQYAPPSGPPPPMQGGHPGAFALPRLPTFPASSCS